MGGGEGMLFSIVPVQGVRLADGAELDLGNATLAEVTSALVDEHMGVLRTILERRAKDSEAAVEARLRGRRKHLEDVVGSPAVLLREDRAPDLDTETDRLFLLAEDALDRLRLALFLNRQWRFGVQRRTRYSISVGARSVHGRLEAYFMSPAGGGADLYWDATPVPLRVSEPDLEALLGQLDAASAARTKTMRAYRLLSDALEITRPENFLVLVASALETLLLEGSGNEIRANLARRVRCITGSAEHERRMKELYDFRSDVVHGRTPKAKRSVGRLHSDVIEALRLTFMWSLEQRDIEDLMRECGPEQAAAGAPPDER